MNDDLPAAPPLPNEPAAAVPEPAEADTTLSKLGDQTPPIDDKEGRDRLLNWAHEPTSVPESERIHEAELRAELATWRLALDRPADAAVPPPPPSGLTLLRASDWRLVGLWLHWSNPGDAVVLDLARIGGRRRGASVLALADDLVRRIERTTAGTVLVHLGGYCANEKQLADLALQRLDPGTQRRIVLCTRNWSKAAINHILEDTGLEPLPFEDKDLLRGVAFASGVVTSDEQHTRLVRQLTDGMWTAPDSETGDETAFLDLLAGDPAKCREQFDFLSERTPGDTALSARLQETIAGLAGGGKPAHLAALFLLSRFGAIDLDLFEMMHAGLAPALLPAHDKDSKTPPISPALTDAILPDCEAWTFRGPSHQRQVRFRHADWAPEVARLLRIDAAQSTRTLEAAFMGLAPALAAHESLGKTAVRLWMSRLVDDGAIGTQRGAEQLLRLLFPPERQRHALARNIELLGEIVAAYAAATSMPTDTATATIARALLPLARQPGRAHRSDLWGLFWAWTFRSASADLPARLALLLDALQEDGALRPAAEGFAKVALPRLPESLARISLALLEAETEESRTAPALLQRHILAIALRQLVEQNRADATAIPGLDPALRAALRHQLAARLAEDGVPEMQATEFALWTRVDAQGDDIPVQQLTCHTVRQNVLQAISLLSSTTPGPLSFPFTMEFATECLKLVPGLELFRPTPAFLPYEGRPTRAHVAVMRLCALPLLVALVSLHDRDAAGSALADEAVGRPFASAEGKKSLAEWFEATQFLFDSAGWVRKRNGETGDWFETRAERMACAAASAQQLDIIRTARRLLRPGR